MKNLHLIIFAFLTTLLSFSQQKKDFKRDHLSFSEFVEQSDKKGCFNNYIAKKLTETIKAEIKNYLEKNEKRTYVVNHASFVVGENGKPIKSSIKTTNPKNSDVGLKLKLAILDLPEIMVRLNEYNYPVLTHYTLSIKNGVNENGEVVVLDLNNKPKAISKKNSMVAPIYNGCKSKDNNELKKCLSYKVSKVVSQKFNTKKALKGFNKKGTFYTFVFFTIDKKGKLDNLRAFGPNKAFQDQAIASLKKIKRIKPGTKDGEPIRVSFSLPIKMKVD